VGRRLGSRPIASSLGRLLRASLAWSIAVAGTTASIGALGRTFCLPPYWPAEFLTRCRPGGLGAALPQLGGDVLVTTALLALPLLPVGAMVHLGAGALARRTGQRGAAVAVGLCGGLVWVWLARRLEVSYLDFILGGYAIGAGALAGVAIAIRQSRRCRPGPDRCAEKGPV
jgi:hypothetical protein